LPRDLPLGNGDFLVTFDARYQLRDIYYPHVGQENHTVGAPCRFGIWVDGKFSWIGGDDWECHIEYEHETLVGDTTAHNETLGLRLRCRDAVDFDRNIYFKEVTVEAAQTEWRRQRAALDESQLDLVGVVPQESVAADGIRVGIILHHDCVSLPAMSLEKCRQFGRLAHRVGAACLRAYIGERFPFSGHVSIYLHWSPDDSTQYGSIEYASVTRAPQYVYSVNSSMQGPAEREV